MKVKTFDNECMEKLVKFGILAHESPHKLLCSTDDGYKYSSVRAILKYVGVLEECYAC